MRLGEWVKAKGKAKGELSRLCRATTKSYTTIFKLAHGHRSKAEFATARRLAMATGGVCSHLELCLSDEQLAQVEAWELKAWREFAITLERERAARATGRRKPTVAA